MNFVFDFEKTPSDFKIVQQMHESGIKLKIKSQTIAVASVLYHRFFQAVSEEYEKYLVAAACMYIAGKSEEDHIKIRDIINVFHRLINKDAGPVDYEHYLLLRESIAKLELLVMRMLQFRIVIDYPHNYMLHYLKAIYDWLDPKVVIEAPVARTCWSLLSDFYHDPRCLKHDAKHLAVAIIYMSLQIFSVSVPCNNECTLTWYQVFCKDITIDKIWDIIQDVINVYEREDSEVD